VHKELAQRIADMITGALEGGSTYFFDLNPAKPAPVNLRGVECKDGEKWWDAIVRHLVEGTDFIITVRTEDTTTGILTPWNCVQGLKVMQDKYYLHYRDMIAENDDADTADIYLQSAMWGKVIYG
jgi:hypothetical protein